MIKLLGRQNNSDSEDDHIIVEIPQPEQGAKNVVVFGESGVGKSSLINLIAGQKVSETSSGALGCTLEYKRHLLDLGEQQFGIWDTAGLDEGTQGSVPAEKAEAYLKHLLQELVKNNGIDLLVYCVRGTRVRSALLTNYHIFYSAICRRKVPIAVVITGLENQEGTMETWWHTNKPQFSQLKMLFDGHACVTTLESPIENATLKERREESRTAVIKMITSTCRTLQWRPPERSWLESAYSDIRAMLSPKSGPNSRSSGTIILCEAYRVCDDQQLCRRRSISFQTPITLSLSLNPLSFRSPVSISDSVSRSRLPFEYGVKSTPERLYRVYQVSPSVPSEETGNVTVIKRAANLLIFCVKLEGTEPSTVKSQWEYFNLTYGGDLSPQIIVVIGVSDQLSADAWWKDVVGRTPATNDIVTYWSEGVAADKDGAEQQRLRHLINDRCIDYSKVTQVKDEKSFRLSLRLDMSSLTSLLRPESNGTPSSEQDLFTRCGVWQEHSESPSSTASPSPVKEWQGPSPF